MSRPAAPPPRRAPGAALPIVVMAAALLVSGAALLWYEGAGLPGTPWGQEAGSQAEPAEGGGGPGHTGMEPVPDAIREVDAVPDAPEPSPESTAPPAPEPGAGSDGDDVAPEPAPSDPEPEPQPEPPEPVEEPPEGVHRRAFAWSHGGTDWTVTLDIPEDSYTYFRGLERPHRVFERDSGWVRQPAYDVLVTHPGNAGLVDILAQELAAGAERHGIQHEEMPAFVLDFVQSLRYAADNETTGFDDYPRFPVETLVDEGGDCEDTSILFAALLLALGHDAVLVSPPGHMAVGVGSAPGTTGTGYMHGDGWYLYAETTGQGWRIGEIPPVYQDDPVQVFVLEPAPLFSLEVEFGGVVEGRQQVSLEARHTGSADASGVRLFAGLHAGDDLFYHHETCSFASVQPDERVACVVWMDLRTVPRGEEAQIVTRVFDDLYLYDEARSTWWTPRPAEG